MDLRSGYAFWPVQDGLIASYPPLRESVVCDVAVIGGGITGALVAYHLALAGVDTVVVERRDVGGGSTSASTALLQYEVDTHLTDLIGMVGRDHAERSYLLCREAILKLERLVSELGENCGFARKKSLYLASTPEDAARLYDECEARTRIGIDVAYLDKNEIDHRFPFSAPAALLSQTAAQVDPYRLTHALLGAGKACGLRVYDRTAVTRYTYGAADVELQTDRGAVVRARCVVFAAGYEAQSYLEQRLVTFRSTYAFISEPLEDFAGWGENNCLIWESARPYLYMRTTEDGRVLVGGEDDPFDNERRRTRRIPRKTERLLKRFHDLLPNVELEVAYAWAGVFGETEDGLAYIGATEEFPNAYFALGYGGNGITYSMIGAEIIRDAITGRPNADAEIFSFRRKQRTSKAS